MLAGSGLHSALLRAAEQNGAGLLAPKAAHHAAKAQNLIVIFLTGGFSHVDTFDYKPALAPSRRAGAFLRVAKRRNGQAPAAGLSV